MKKIFFAILAIIFSSTLVLNAQNQPDALSNILQDIFQNSPEQQSSVLLNDTVKEYSLQNGTWNLTKVFSKAYDNTDRIIEIYQYSIGAGGSFNYQTQWVFTYNTNGQITQSLKSHRQGNNWVGEELILFTHNAKGLLSQELIREFDVTIWVNILKNDYSYDSQDRIIEATNCIYTLNTWEFETRTIYTYDVGINRREAIMEAWTANGWQDTIKTVTTFDWFGNLLDEYVYSWNISSWENKNMIFFSFDSNYNLVEELVYSWSGGSWKNASRDIHAYDQNQYLLCSEHQQWVSNAWAGKNKLTFHYYDPNVVGLEQNDLITTVTAYPNPFTEKVRVQSSNPFIFNNSKICLFDMNGRLIHTEVLASNAMEYTLFRNGIPAGMYIIDIRSVIGLKATQRLIIHD